MSSSPRTQAERTEESARRLMEAALALIAEQGFERTTATQIAQRAGYSRTMVRERYGSKDALLEALFESELASWLLPKADVESGLDRLLSQVDHLLEWAEAAPERAKSFMVLSFEAAGPIPSLRPWYSEWMRRYEAEAAANLRLGQADGSVREGLDLDYESKAFCAFGLGLAFRWALDFDGYDFPGEVAVWRRGTIARYAANQ